MFKGKVTPSETAMPGVHFCHFNIFCFYCISGGALTQAKSSLSSWFSTWKSPANTQDKPPSPDKLNHNSDKLVTQGEESDKPQQ